MDMRKAPLGCPASCTSARMTDAVYYYGTKQFKISITDGHDGRVCSRNFRTYAAPTFHRCSNFKDCQLQLEEVVVATEAT